MVAVGMVCVDVNALDAMVEGEVSLKTASKYWGLTQLLIDYSAV